MFEHFLSSFCPICNVYDYIKYIHKQIDQIFQPNIHVWERLWEAYSQYNFFFFLVLITTRHPLLMTRKHADRRRDWILTFKIFIDVQYSIGYSFFFQVHNLIERMIAYSGGQPNIRRCLIYLYNNCVNLIFDSFKNKRQISSNTAA